MGICDANRVRSSWRAIACVAAVGAAGCGVKRKTEVSVNPDVFSAASPKETSKVACVSASYVKKGIVYLCADGSSRTGTLSAQAEAASAPKPDVAVSGAAESLPPCSAGVEAKCVATAEFPAVRKAELAGSLGQGSVVAGVSGTLALKPADCLSDGQTGCVTTTRFRAADTASSALDPWDIRKGKQVGGVLGLLKTCRNRANALTAPGNGVVQWDNVTSPALFGLDAFDTVDDWNGNDGNALPADFPWGVSYACGGIYRTGIGPVSDAAGNWVDVTPGVKGDGTASANAIPGCNDADKHCVFRDLVSGLKVTEVSGALTPDNWYGAISHCAALGSLHTVGPDGAVGMEGGWRLPTQKELMQLQVDGIRGLQTTSFGQINGWFWSSTRLSSTYGAWQVNLSDGSSYSDLESKNGNLAVCVK